MPDGIEELELHAGVAASVPTATGRSSQSLAVILPLQPAQAARAKRMAFMRQRNERHGNEVEDQPNNAAVQSRKPATNNRGGPGTQPKYTYRGELRKGNHGRTGCPTHCTSCRSPKANCSCQPIQISHATW